MPSLVDSQEALDLDGVMIVIALKIGGCRAALQPHVIYYLRSRKGGRALARVAQELSVVLSFC
jgi:hypothetical protein